MHSKRTVVRRPKIVGLSNSCFLVFHYNCRVGVYLNSDLIVWREHRLQSCLQEFLDPVQRSPVEIPTEFAVFNEPLMEVKWLQLEQIDTQSFSRSTQGLDTKKYLPPGVNVRLHFLSGYEKIILAVDFSVARWPGRV